MMLIMSLLQIGIYFIMFFIFIFVVVYIHTLTKKNSTNSYDKNIVKKLNYDLSEKDMDNDDDPINNL